MTDSSTDDQDLPIAGLLTGGGADSDVDSSQSVCSGSDTHSGHTSLSILTDKSSSASVTTVHVTNSSRDSSSSLLVTAHSPEPPDGGGTSYKHSPISNTGNSGNSGNGASNNNTLSTTTVVTSGGNSVSGGGSVVTVGNRGTLLPWGVHKDRSPLASAGPTVDMDIRPGEFVMRTLFADFTLQAERKIETVMSEPQEKPLSKLLQRGEDTQFDQLLSAFGSVAEHCLPSLLRALFSWYERQMSELLVPSVCTLLSSSHPLQNSASTAAGVGGSCGGSQNVLGQDKDSLGGGGIEYHRTGSTGSGSGSIGSNLLSTTTKTLSSSITTGTGSISLRGDSTLTASVVSGSSGGKTSGIMYMVSGGSVAGGSGTMGSSASGDGAKANSGEVESGVGQERRDLAVEFIFCLVLIEVLRQLSFHPGHEDLVQYIENLAFQHFKYRDGTQTGPNAANHHIISDLYAEVVGALAQSRFTAIRSRFTSELRELRSRDPPPVTNTSSNSTNTTSSSNSNTASVVNSITGPGAPRNTQAIISLLMGMKFFRVKMVPIEEFEASFQFMQECAQYFLDPNVKDKDIKHALAGLFVEILVPVAASVKNEVNVPCLKNFVEMLYSSTLDASTKSKHRLALFPLITCLLCVSQKAFFLQNWHCFLAMCLSHLKNRDHKMCRVALESLYRLLWVYMIRIKCESNSATQSRLQSIVNSLFPKGSKAVVPRDTPLNIFVKIIQFIAQERLDFAMREIVFDLLSVGRPIKIILTPERMSIGLRAFLVVADSLQQKDPEPPMPRAIAVLPSGNTLRRAVRKTYLNRLLLTEATAQTIGMSAYFPHVRRVFVDILRALDVQYGRPLMMTSAQNVNKEPDEMMTGERKPRIDLFRTCVAAVPRLIPDGMTSTELVDLLSRLTVHMDEELRGLAFQSLQTLVLDMADWRPDVLLGFSQFLCRDVLDTVPQLLDSGLRMLLQLLSAWRTSLVTPSSGTGSGSGGGGGMTTTGEKMSGGGGGGGMRPGNKDSDSKHPTHPTIPSKPEPLSAVLHHVEAFALVMLCHHRPATRRVSVHVLREVKTLLRLVGEGGGVNGEFPLTVIDVMDQCCPAVLDKCLGVLPQTERSAISSSTQNIDMLWLADRSSCIWMGGLQEDGTLKAGTIVNINAPDPWSLCLFGFLERERLLSLCPVAISYAWPIVFTRINTLFPVIDPTPVNDNRASLLRSSATIKKPLNERDMYINLWKNYITFAFRVVPPVPSPIIRCASPDLSLSSLEPMDSSTTTTTVVDNNNVPTLSASLENLAAAALAAAAGGAGGGGNSNSEVVVVAAAAIVAPSPPQVGLLTAAGNRFTLPLSAMRRQHKRTSSSPDSLNAERNDNKASGVNVSPNALYKLVVPLLRCEVNDVRDSAVIALGYVNSDALKDLMEELVVYIREAVDRKQENVRRRRRRDALRLQLIRVLELIAEYGTFAVSSSVLDRDTLHPIFVEYMEGARVYLESEPDKTAVAVKEMIMHFCKFIRKMIKSFSLDTCQKLLDRELRRSLFSLFCTWSGSYGSPLLSSNNSTQQHSNATHHHHQPAGDSNSIGRNKTVTSSANDLQLAALQAMSALLCCGPCFNATGLGDDGGKYYQWLDVMLDSADEKIYSLARETVVLLLECNPDIGPLLDWAVDRCYTGTQAVADGCFLSLATIFSAREYPCDHYTAVINVTLMNTGCPRPLVRDTALQLLQLLDKRFFGAVGPLAEADLAEGDNGRSTLDALLSSSYCRSQIHLSRQLALLHPELTMPMFSEITVRFQTARPEVRQLLLQYILPWLHNMELVDPNIPPSNPLFYYQFNSSDTNRPRGRREGWGSAEATEMVLNNVFYITAKFGDNHPKEIEDVWSTLCTSWPNNMKIIIRYLIIISGMAPMELLPYAKRVILFLARVQSVRLLDEMMIELQTVETLNCLIERTETPPFYRLTVMRKASSHSDGTGAGQTDSNSRSDLGVEKGTIHTKRHSGEDPMKCGTPRSDRDRPDYSPKNRQATNNTSAHLSEDICSPNTDDNLEELFSLSRPVDKVDLSIPQPLPLPMPEYGGFFAPLTEYLPESSQPISGFHRCNVAVMLLCDIVVDGVELDWSVQVPLMLHILFLGMDHTRPLVHQHCNQLLLNLLIVLAQHNDHLTVAQIMLNSKAGQLELGLPTPVLPVVTHTFTEPEANFDAYLQGLLPLTNNELSHFTKQQQQSQLPVQQQQPTTSSSSSTISTNSGDRLKEPSTGIPPVIVTPDEHRESISWSAPELTAATANLTTQAVIKSMIEFLATRQFTPLWNYEDITAKVWQVRSADQMDIFLQHVLRVFQESLPSAHVSERWAQTALQLGLSCSSRHYAGRSLQLYRSLRVPITSRMLSDILSRLVETVAEQGEDMQGYVTELLLTLESAVESLESDFRPLDFLRDFFKSTPNLNNKDSPHNLTSSSHQTSTTPTHPSQTAGVSSHHHSHRQRSGGATTTTTAVTTTGNSNNAISGGDVDVVMPMNNQHGGGGGGGVVVTSGHARSTSYSVSYGMRKGGGGVGGGNGGGSGGNGGSSPGGNLEGGKEIRGRTASEIEARSNHSLYKYCAHLSRSRSAQSLKLLGDSAATQDDKLTILAQLFWLSVSLLESDYEHEFLLALRLLARVLHRLPLDRPDARDKVEKLQSQLRWGSFPGVHALLLKGCTHPNIYEPVVALLSQFTPLLDLLVVDPSQSIAFPMNVIALLPYMLLNYEDANELCITSAENIAQVSIEKSKKLENLGTVMNLYSRRTFSKESFQWTKCVVKYLYDTYSHLSLNMLTFLVEVLEKGPVTLQLPVLNILHCMLHYIDLASAAAQPINADLLRIIARYIEGAHWKEALKILKLVVTRSSSLVAPPTSLQYHSHWETSITALPHPSFSDIDVFTRKELPGRTMDFTFDLSQTPVIGRRLLSKKPPVIPEDGGNGNGNGNPGNSKPIASPRRSCSLSPADTGPLSGWKRPWMSQGRVRECLVNLLTTCGQRVGLPKSPSVIFSQSSDLLERQSSMASSTEEVSAGNNDLSGGSRRDDATADFGVFKDFDFLEYESESIEAESTDNFNWGVRRRPLSEGEEEQPSLRQLEDSISEQTPVLTVRKRVVTEESSDDEIGSESPLDEIVAAPEFENSSSTSASNLFPPSSLRLSHTRRDSNGARSDTSESSAGDLGDVTPCNDSPNISALMNLRPMPRSDTIETWTLFVQTCSTDNSSNILKLFHHLQKLIKNIASSSIVLTRDACGYLSQSQCAANTLPLVKLISARLASMADICTYRILPDHHVWFNTTVLGGNNARLTECLKYGMYEVQEHLETFCSKMEQATMYSDAVKTSLKLELLSGQQTDSRHEDYLLDLSKSLYKLHFQLLLLIEAANKMTGHLVTALRIAHFRDVSAEVKAVNIALIRAGDDVEQEGIPQATSPSGFSLEDVIHTVFDLITTEKYSSAMSFIRQHRNVLVRPSSSSEGATSGGIEDTATLVINTYCRKLMVEKPDCFVVTNQDCDMGDIYGRLFQVSAALNDLESIINSEYMQTLNK